MAKSGIRLLVCGGRDYHWTDAWNWLERNAYDYLSFTLEINRPKISVLVHGGARGADEGAAMWGESENLKVIEYKANWKRFGKSAGPVRNQQMLDEGKPDVVIALPGGHGTRDMIKRAEEAGITVIHVK